MATRQIDHHTRDETEDPHARKFLWILIVMPLLVFAFWLIEQMVMGS